MSFDYKFSRTFVELRADSTCVLKAELGTLDIKRRKSGIIIISLPIGSLFKLAFMTLLSMFFVDPVSLMTSFKKVPRHYDLIKTHVVIYPKLIR